MDPVVWLLGVLALLGVGLSLWLLRERDRLRAELVAARGEGEVARARLADEEAARSRFQSLADEALRRSNEEFLKLARESLAAREATALAEMDKRRERFDQLVAPIQDVLGKTKEELSKIERGHVGLRTEIEEMRRANTTLRDETGKLSQALRKPNVRGRYGEIQLERVVELAGMRSYCDFNVQENVRDEQGRLQRPDMIVRLPNERLVAVDAKTSVDAYLDALDAPTEAEASQHLDRYAENVMLQAQRLARKEYWSQFEDSPELVVMFIPSDQLVDAALERRPKLIDLAAERNVVIASPSTLIGLLRAIHVGWRERSLSESAQELFVLGRELHERAAVVLEHASAVGDSLDKACAAYNRFVGSVDARLVPTLRKFEERGARSARELVRPREVESQARELRNLTPPDEDAELLEEPGPTLPRPAPRAADESNLFG